MIYIREQQIRKQRIRNPVLGEEDGRAFYQNVRRTKFSSETERLTFAF